MYSVSLVALMQQFNFGIIFYSLNILLDIGIVVNNYVAYSTYFLFLIPNLFRYRRIKSYKKFDELWGQESPSIKKRKGVLLVIYIILSTLILFIGAIYLGKIKRGEL